MEKIYYRVAECTFCIQTPDAKATAALLPSFVAFAVPAPDDEQEVLFTLTGNDEFEIPEMPPLRTGNIEGLQGSQLNTKEAVYIVLNTAGHSYRMKASSDWRRIATSYTLTRPNESFLLAKTLSLVLEMCLILQGATTIHASVIEKDGKALLFLGVSGTGKSTHSSLWLKHVEGCSLLNDDEPIIRPLPCGGVRVYGTPWSGKTPCYRNISADVVAFVHLRQSPDNHLQRLSMRDAVNALAISISMPQNDIHASNKQLDNICTFAERLPVYRLDCRPDREAVSLTETLMP